jgi:hypothetical protein
MPLTDKQRQFCWIHNNASCEEWIAERLRSAALGNPYAIREIRDARLNLSKNYHHNGLWTIGAEAVDNLLAAAENNARQLCAHSQPKLA